MRAQISIEYLFITGLVLALITPIIYMSAVTSSQSRHDALYYEVQRLGNTIELVHAQGYPAKERIWIGMPSEMDLSETYVQNGTVKVSFLEGDRRIDIISTISTEICILGNLPTVPGYHLVAVSNRDGCVLLNESGGE